jgi:thiamine-phosphate pyrophosphorylase
MPFAPQLPPHALIYLITSGQTTLATTSASKELQDILELVRLAVAAKIDFVQIREKNLRVSVLYELARAASAITSGTTTKLLINDRADVAAAAGADGVHLARTSLQTDVVRRTLGPDFLIGVSTHSIDEVVDARRDGADFAVFGPVFETNSKKEYGPPLGLNALVAASSKVAPFPVLALGGVTQSLTRACLDAGAHGVAGISMFQESRRLGEIADAIRQAST